MSDRADAVVVGGGLLGLAAAAELAGRGRSVVVLERATSGHERSGSKGTARVFRLGYDDPFYVDLARRSLELWRGLEAARGRRLLTPTGQVTFGHDLATLEAAMAAAGAPVERLGAGEAATRFPDLAVEGDALYEPESGVLAADAVLDELARTPGVEVRERTCVTGLDDDGRRARVDTAEGRWEAPVAVVCAGPGTPALLGRDGYGAAASLEQVAYLPAPAGGLDRLPVFIDRDDPWVYGLPVAGEGRVKIALHGGGPVVDPDDRLAGPDPALLARLDAAAGRLLPGLGPVQAGERCLYDNTPDEDFVVDRIGNVVVGAGTSGHGFKFGPLLGRFLADLATGTEPPVDLGRFARGRPALNQRRSGAAALRRTDPERGAGPGARGRTRGA